MCKKNLIYFQKVCANENANEIQGNLLQQNLLINFIHVLFKFLI